MSLLTLIRVNLDSRIFFRRKSLSGVRIWRPELALRPPRSPPLEDGIGIITEKSSERTSADDGFPVVITELTFPSVTVESVPFTIHTDLPAYGCVQTPLFVSYLVRNRTLQVQEVEVTVEPSDAFMYSGHKQIQFRLLPTGDHRLKFSLYPLCAGFVTLPKLHFNLPRFQISWDEHAQKMVPTNVFIKPRGREIGF